MSPDNLTILIAASILLAAIFTLTWETTEMSNQIWSGTAQLVSGGWSYNPYCMTCEEISYFEYEESRDERDKATYVTLRIPTDQISLGALDRYELTITKPEGTP